MTSISHRPVEPAHLPSIVIVTPSFNQAQYIPKTIESVIGQSYPNLQYIVQDSVSTDGTVDFLLGLQHRDCAVHIEKDGGQADALNRGFARTHSEVMAYINSDDMYLPGTLHAVGSFFATHPDVDVIYGNRLVIDEADLEIGRWILPGHDETVIRNIDYVPQETMFWRRRIWNEVGACFDEDLHFAMDWDLILRFMSAGAVISHVPELFGLFRVHGRQKTQADYYSIGLKEVMELRRRYANPCSHGWILPVRHASYLIRHKKLDRAFSKSIVGSEE